MINKEKPVFIWPMARTGGTLFATMLGVHSELAMSYEIYEDCLCEVKGEYMSPVMARDILLQSAIDAGLSVEPSDLSDAQIKKWISNISQPPFRSFVARAHRGALDPYILIKTLEEFIETGKGFELLEHRLDFIEILMKYKAEFDGKTYWGGKAKVSLEVLCNKYPDACIFMMVRDGRDMLTSRMNVGAFDKDPKLIASEWVEHMELFDRVKKTHKGVMHQVSYEKLVYEPVSELKKVCNCIEIDYEESMVGYEQQDLTLLKNPYGHLSATQISKGINDESIGRWKTELPKEALTAFEEVAGEKLREKGYVVG
ncbi:MAG: hypothetical protein C0603_09935 [Denitrovibrio sp.]|nr:MAG: hypothetical protein C0603_09935 [Denitrovibrio sp.]